MARGTGFILLLLVGMLLAGCLGDSDSSSKAAGKSAPLKARGVDPSVYESKLSKELYRETLKEHVLVPSFDGKRMDNWVFRPKTPEGTTVPVFINFSPYWSNLAPSAESGGDAFSKHMMSYFGPRGYAIVLSSLRGTGYSEGCFNIGGEVEQRDAVAVIEHFAKQPWSNGNVAAGGKSYDGTTPQGAAIHAPPALKAIFPVSGISELYKYNYKGGIPFGQGAVFNTYYFVGESTQQTWASNPLLAIDDLACPYLPEMQVSGVGSGVTGDYTSYWVERNYSRQAKDVKAALFFVHGFTDWNVKPDHILPWLDLVDGPKKVWLHNWTQRNDGHVYPMRDDWNLTMLRFLDQTLKGINTSIFDEPAYQIQDSDGRWRWEESWPPTDAVPTRFFLTSKDGRGSLEPAASPRAAARQFIDRGLGPQPTVQSSEAFLRYESPVLEADLHYAGEPIVHLQASTDRPVGKIVAALYDIGPGGQFKLINWGGLNFRHRIALENPQPVAPGATYALNFPLFPQDDVVPAGHRLVLFLAGSGGSFLGIPYQSTVTVLENEQAFLELPLQSRFEWEDPQPVPMPCFAC